MAGRTLETLLSYHCLTGPLVKDPVSVLDKVINKLQVKYRSYIVEYDVEDGVVRLPSMFGADFGDQIGRFAKLTDQKQNQFEVLVERINGAFFFTKGWKAIRDFYGVGLGAWVTLIFIGPGQFVMELNDRFHKKIKSPIFDPPMHFMIDKSIVHPMFNDHLPPITSLISYRHNINDMVIDFTKKLIEYDVTKGFLMLIYEGSVAQVFNAASLSVILVDECGNSWDYVFLFGTAPLEHCRISGQWKRIVDARRMCEGVGIRLGALVAGKKDAVYLTVIYN